MLGFNKKATQVKDEPNIVEIACCPLCKSVTSHMFFMQDHLTRVKSKWYACSCGILWQTPYPDTVYNKAYADEHMGSGSKFEASSRYVPQIVCPLIEESIYGRKVLFIGHVPYQEKEFKRRGWVTFTIDKNIDYATTERMISADFETFEFPEDNKFNLIWLYHTLECFLDPFKALAKVTSLLAEDGIISIWSPDSDFLYTRGLAGFKHWKKDYNHILWSLRTIRPYLEQLGFNVILSRRNHDLRLPETDDFCILAQRKFY